VRYYVDDVEIDVDSTLRAGNEARSAPVNVIVDNARDWEAPTVYMSAPANNSQVTGIATLSATATDNIGVTRVAFQTLDGTLIGEDDTAPFSITRDTSDIPSGRSFNLRAFAYDAAGNVRSSPAIRVTVQH
jgi:hypothetical protein